MAKKSNFWDEFKSFISRGNVLDMAVGVVVGSAFTAIVNSLVKNIINPVVGLATGGVDFSNLKIVLKAATEETAELAIEYGLFINAIINFLIIALVVFTIVRSFNKIKAQAEEKAKAKNAEEIAKAEAEKKAAEEAKKAEEQAKKAAEAKIADTEIALLKEIRDLLKK